MKITFYYVATCDGCGTGELAIDETLCPACKAKIRNASRCLCSTGVRALRMGHMVACPKARTVRT